MRKCVAFIAGILLFVGMNDAHAFSVAPLRINAIVSAGKEQVLAITVTNDELQARQYLLGVTSVKQDASGRPIFGRGNEVVPSWVALDTNTLLLKSHEKKDVHVTVKAPIGTEPGAYYAALIIKEVNTSTSTIGVSAEIAVLMGLAVEGKVHEGLSIEKWQATSVRGKNEWMTTIDLKNTGSVAVPISGKILVSNWRGHVLQEVAVDLGNNVLPGAVRAVKKNISPMNMWPGPYRLDSVVVYGRSQSVARASQTVWYIPAWSVASIVVVCIITILIYGYSNRKKHL